MSFLRNINNSDEKRRIRFNGIHDHELKVEELTVSYLCGELGYEDYKRESWDFDYRLDLRKIASKLG